ncbi:hypothetical protein CORC01_13498 [Colletotrichum orchidophilum]|uniref:Uncharacterized protein n=1 Tax=Colletotrichum orchidophilum TaxID=1209926 RepID=A0A1G4AQ44_9PEZI|nr:uncharacterized protein CORC01_13498 [Colletotrichum orchidophilum]OHE91221.1 hypothetical protein CORC01_13498 [Colletotrichum orchidophilum]
MTGITDKSSEERHENASKEQLYESAKKIASKFSVFDLGITCIQRQPDGSYKTESYSFIVSPYLHTETRADEKFVNDLDRSLSVSYGTLKFLRKEGILLEKIYDDCVPHLSRKDARLANERMTRRKEPWDARGHDYDEYDEGLYPFCIYVHDTIVKWQHTYPWERAAGIKILLPNSGSKKRMSVYKQIVRKQAQELVPHMGCRLWNHGTTVIISELEDEREARRRESLRDTLKASLSKYTGIRLVIEALAGGDFADLIDPSLIVDAMSGWPGEARDFCREVHEFLHLLSPEQSEGTPEDEVEDHYCEWCLSYHERGTDCPGSSFRQDPEIASQTNLAAKDECLCARKQKPSRHRARDTEMTPLVYDIHCERCYPDLGSGLPRAEDRSHAAGIRGTNSGSHDTESRNSWRSSTSSEGVVNGGNEESDCSTWDTGAEATGWDESTAWYNLCQNLEDLSTETLDDSVADALEKLETRLQTRRPVIVGHNQFMDLLFLYNTFIDDLPDTWEDFSAKIHELFPSILDTKLLAIEDEAIEGEDPLKDLYNRFDRDRTRPSVFWEAAYGYGRHGTAHQAGFDSYMTAVVFLRIAHKLAREEMASLEGQVTTHKSKVKRLYDREWLSAIGYDSRLLGYPRDFNSGKRRETNTREVHVGPMLWDMPTFDNIRNWIRIAPRKTVYLGRTSW